MKNILIIMLSAISMIAGVEAKPEVRPEMPIRPIEVKVKGKKSMPKFDGKRHSHKHHVRPHRCHKHVVRPVSCKDMKRHHRKPVRRVNIHR